MVRVDICVGNLNSSRVQMIAQGQTLPGVPEKGAKMRVRGCWYVVIDHHYLEPEGPYELGYSVRVIVRPCSI